MHGYDQRFIPMLRAAQAATAGSKGRRTQQGAPAAGSRTQGRREAPKETRVKLQELFKEVETEAKKGKSLNFNHPNP